MKMMERKIQEKIREEWKTVEEKVESEGEESFES